MTVSSYSASIPTPPPRYYPDERDERFMPAAHSPRSRRRIAHPPMQQADEEPRRLPELKTDVDDRDNLVTCVCPSGGAGLSVTASLLALSLGDRGRSCALVDADCMAGGLDVLLGIEREQGMRRSAKSRERRWSRNCPAGKMCAYWAPIPGTAAPPNGGRCRRPSTRWSRRRMWWWSTPAAVHVLTRFRRWRARRC